MHRFSKTNSERHLLLWILLVIPACSFSQPHCLFGRYAHQAMFDSAAVIVQQDIVYAQAVHAISGQEVVLELDLFFPDPDIDPLAQRPLIVLVHGGGFATGNRSAMHFQCMEYARRGFVAATISYRLGWNCDPNSGILLCALCGGQQSAFRTAVYNAVQDTRAALRFLSFHASDYGIDPENVFIGGESAGAITALHTAFWQQEEASEFAPAAPGISGALDGSGNDLEGNYVLRAVVANCGAVFGTDIIDAGEAIPIIAFHDAADCVVPYGSGQVLGCFGCTAFPVGNGSSVIYSHLTSLDVCCELNTVPNSLNHCSWPALFLVRRAACFMKRVLCDVCTTSTNNDIYAVSPCASPGTLTPVVPGCTYTAALNYSPDANVDDGSCQFAAPSCVADLDSDGAIGTADLLLFLSLFGTTCE